MMFQIHNTQCLYATLHTTANKPGRSPPPDLPVWLYATNLTGGDTGGGGSIALYLTLSPTPSFFCLCITHIAPPRCRDMRSHLPSIFRVKNKKKSSETCSHPEDYLGVSYNHTHTTPPPLIRETKKRVFPTRMRNF